MLDDKEGMLELKPTFSQCSPTSTLFNELMNDRSLDEYHRRYAAAVGCPVPNKSSIDTAADCLRALPASVLLEHMFMFDECNMFPFG